MTPTLYVFLKKLGLNRETDVFNLSAAHRESKRETNEPVFTIRLIKEQIFINFVFFNPK